MSIDFTAGESHYKVGDIEPIEYIERNKLPFAEGCIVKYASRHEHKPEYEAIKDLYDIAIYAYLIMKWRYKCGPLVDGRSVPTMKNANAPLAPSAPSSAPVPPPWTPKDYLTDSQEEVEVKKGRATNDDWRELYEVLGLSGTIASEREIIARAVEKLRRYRKESLEKCS